jgi:hypothetical protein
MKDERGRMTRGSAPRMKDECGRMTWFFQADIERVILHPSTFHV